MTLFRLIAATSNPGKLREFRTLLEGLPLAVDSLEGHDPVDDGVIDRLAYARGTAGSPEAVVAAD